MRKLFLFFIIFSNLSCSNIFLPAADKTTDAAIYEDGLKALNNQDYDTAIAKLTSLKTDEYTQSPTVKMNLAGAYAGKCGFNFINYIGQMANPNTGGNSIFKFLMNQWTTVTTDRDSCKSAGDVVKSITPTYVGRSADQSLFMALLGLAKMGIYLRELADTDLDGEADVVFDVTNPVPPANNAFCLVGNGSDGLLTNEDIANIGTGLAMFLANLGNVGASFSTSLNTADLTAACNAVGTAPNNPCYMEDEDTFEANPDYLRAIRSLLNVTSTGLVNGLICTP
jgi:hypothetical protein